MSSERVPPLVDFDYYDGDARLNRPPEWLTEYYEDHFPEPVDFDFEEGDVEDEVLMKAFGTAQSVEEILEHCVQPTVSTVAEYVGVLLVWCIAFRMVTQLGWHMACIPLELQLMLICFFKESFLFGRAIGHRWSRAWVLCGSSST